jgi:DNA (cytosine-5)-methyltransferase 1
MIKIASVFAGIGGICLAFKENGCEVVWANEIDKYACKTYRENFLNTFLVEGDIKDISISSIPDFDILTAGFPCQTFSSVGLKKGFKDPRGTLFFEIIRIVKAKKPRVVFLENVANLVKHDDGETFKTIKGSLEKCGYNVTYKVMNAKEYGNIPQQRNRIYIVAFKYKRDFKKFVFPEPTPLLRTAFDFLDKLEADSKYSMNNHKQYSKMIEYMKLYDRIYRFTDWGISNGMSGICPTLLAAMGSRFERIPFYFDYESIRLLTPRECARLQGFPESFIFPDQKEKEIYKQIGNSVCLPVVSRIAYNIMESLK